MATWDTTTIVIHTWITEITEVTSLTAEVATGAHVTVIELQVTLLYLKLIMCLKFPTFFSFFFVCFYQFYQFCRKDLIGNPEQQNATENVCNICNKYWKKSYYSFIFTFKYDPMLYHIQPTSVFPSRCKNKTRPRISKKLDFELGFGWVLHDLLKVHMAYLNIFFI